MEMDLQEMKERLMTTNEEFSRLAKEHSRYEQKLEQLSGQRHLTDVERLEEASLKKRKLSLKDQMERILQKYKKEGCLTP